MKGALRSWEENCSLEPPKAMGKEQPVRSVGNLGAKSGRGVKEEGSSNALISGRSSEAKMMHVSSTEILRSAVTEKQ